MFHERFLKRKRSGWVHDGLEDRVPKIGVDIYTESIHKKFVKLAQKLIPFATPPVRVTSKRHSIPPSLLPECIL